MSRRGERKCIGYLEKAVWLIALIVSFQTTNIKRREASYSPPTYHAEQQYIHKGLASCINLRNKLSSIDVNLSQYARFRRRYRRVSIKYRSFPHLQPARAHLGSWSSGHLTVKQHHRKKMRSKTLGACGSHSDTCSKGSTGIRNSERARLSGLCVAGAGQGESGCTLVGVPGDHFVVQWCQVCD